MRPQVPATAKMTTSMMVESVDVNGKPRESAA